MTTDTTTTSSEELNHMYHYNPIKHGFLALISININNIYTNANQNWSNFIIRFILLWSAIGIIGISIGYITIGQILPAISPSLYQTTMSVINPYLDMFIWFALSPWFYPCSIGFMVFLFAYQYHIVNRPNRKRDKLKYRITDHLIGFGLYAAILTTAGYAYRIETYPTIASWIFILASVVYLWHDLRLISEADKYDKMDDDSFYPRRLPIAILYGGATFSVAIALNGYHIVGMQAIAMCVCGFGLLLIFRRVYPRIFNTTPRSFYAYSKVKIHQQEMGEKTYYHANFISDPIRWMRNGIAWDFRALTAAKNEKSSNVYDPTGKYDKAINRGVTPTKTTTSKQKIEDKSDLEPADVNKSFQSLSDMLSEAASENDIGLDDITDYNSNPDKISFQERTDRQDTNTDDSTNTNPPSQKTHINRVPKHRSNAPDRDYVTDPDMSDEDFDQPVLHYTTTIDGDLVHDIDQNPLIEAVNTLKELKEVAAERELKKLEHTVESTQKQLKVVWFTLPFVENLRDTINQEWVNHDEFDDELSDLSFQFAKQLTRTQRYLSRQKERNITDKE